MRTFFSPFVLFLFFCFCSARSRSAARVSHEVEISEEFRTNCPSIAIKVSPDSTQAFLEQQIDEYIASFDKATPDQFDDYFRCFASIARQDPSYSVAIVLACDKFWKACANLDDIIYENTMEVLSILADDNHIFDGKNVLKCLYSQGKFVEPETKIASDVFVYLPSSQEQNFTTTATSPMLIQRSIYPYFLLPIEEPTDSFTFTTKNMPESEFYYFCSSTLKMTSWTSCELYATSPTLLSCTCSPLTSTPNKNNENVQRREAIGAGHNGEVYYLLMNFPKATPNKTSGLFIVIGAAILGLGVLGGTLLVILCAGGDDDDDDDEDEKISAKEKAERDQKEDEIMSRIKKNQSEYQSDFSKRRRGDPSSDDDEKNEERKSLLDDH